MWWTAIVGCTEPSGVGDGTGRATDPVTDPVTDTAGGPSGDTAPATDTAAPTTPTELPDTTVPGPYAVEVTDGTRDAGGCTTPFTTYVPSAPQTDAVVILSHGFSRTEAQMVDLATHLASWGVPVATQSMCHATPFDNDPETDAAALVSLADQVGAARRIYLGHSAGGLRSVLAAAADPAAIAVLGLDLVDASDLALNEAPSLTVPLYGLQGEPSACNAEGNGLPVVNAAPTSSALGVVDADHCDFESPTNALCTAFCSVEGDVFDDSEIRDVIFGLATAFVVWQAGSAPEAEGWWDPQGDGYKVLVDNGSVIPL